MSFVGNNGRGAARAPEEVAQLEIVEDAPLAQLPPEALTLLAAAKRDMERAMVDDMQRVGALLAGRIETIHKRLAETKAEVHRIQSHTQALQKDPVNELLRQARERLMGV